MELESLTSFPSNAIAHLHKPLLPLFLSVARLAPRICTNGESALHLAIASEFGFSVALICSLLKRRVRKE